MGLEVPPRRWREKATAEAGRQEAGGRPRGPAGHSPASQGGPRAPEGRRGRAGPPEGLRGDGAGRGGGGAGWGRGAGPHNTISPARPTRDAQAPAPRSPRCTHRGRGSVRAPSGCGVGGWRVCRSLGPGGPVPARVPSSGPSTKQQRLHFRSPCHSGKWLPEVPPRATGTAAELTRLTFPRSRRSPLCAQVPEHPRQFADFVLFFIPRLERDWRLRLSCKTAFLS